MFKKIKVVITCFIYVISQNVYSNNIENILKFRLNKINNFCTNFIQETINEDLDFKEKSNGEICLKKDDFIKCCIYNPRKILIVSNKRDFWVYDTDMNHATVFLTKNVIKNTPLYLIIYSKSLNFNNFNIQKNKDTFVITPNNKNNYFKYLNININKQGIIKKIDYLDTNNYYTSIFFYKYSKLQIKNNEFKFIIPKNTTLNDKRNGD